MPSYVPVSHRRFHRVLVIRDLFFPVGAGIQGFLEVLEIGSARDRIGQLLSVAIFAPLLTLSFFRVKHSTVCISPASRGGEAVRTRRALHRGARRFRRGRRPS